MKPRKVTPVQAMFRRGGLLQGPRLLAAILLVIFLIYYLGSSEPDYDDLPDYDERPQSGRPSYGGREVAQEASAKHKDRESETLGNKFFEYVGQHKPNKVPRPYTAPDLPVPVISTASSGLDSEALKDPVCQVLAKGTKDVLVIVKTPASELYNQLPTRFLTNLRCAPLILFSYVSHKIGSYVVHDALSHVSPTTREKHREFELYDRLQAAQKAYQDFSTITEDNDHNLDRWAVIPSLIESYKLHPEKKWFALIEGDTYISLPNLLSWTSQLNHNVPFYAGAQTLIGTTELGSGAGGLILSRAAVSKLASLYKAKKIEWEAITAQRCCGDQVLAEILKEAGISLHRSWPNTQRESPISIDWSDKHWCRAAVTWHRMTASLMDMLYQFERKWILDHYPEDEPEEEAPLPPPPTYNYKSKHWFKRDAPATATFSATTSASTLQPTSSPKPDFTASIGVPPILFKDVFEGFVIPMVQGTQNRSDWDNWSNSYTIVDGTRGGSYAHSSPETCRAACDIRSRCVQYAHEPNKCRLGTAVRIGEPVGHDRHMKSGWISHRVKGFGKSLGTCKNSEPFFMPAVQQPVAEVETEVQARVMPELEEDELPVVGTDESGEAWQDDDEQSSYDTTDNEEEKTEDVPQDAHQES